MASSLTPRTAYVIQKVEDSLRSESTLKTLLENDTLLGLANGDEFTRPQMGLIAATASLMQDRLMLHLREQADDLRVSLEQERALFAGSIKYTASALKSLYATPFVARLSEPEKPVEAKSQMFSLLNWGNVTALAAVVLFVVATFYTKAYASYKDRAENQGKIIDGLNAQIDKHRSEEASTQQKLAEATKREGDVSGKLEYFRALSEDRDNRIKELEQKREATSADAAEIAKLNTRIEALTADLAKRDEAVRYENQNVTTFKRLYEEEKKRSDELRSSVLRLNQENNGLKTDLGRYTGYSYPRYNNPN